MKDKQEYKIKKKKKRQSNSVIIQVSPQNSMDAKNTGVGVSSLHDYTIPYSLIRFKND